ncbi:MAG: pteridine reductase [Steroidobacteraceae bacterium]
MSEPLEGKVVLITGAARRVGAAIARRLHAAGARVAIHHHRSADAAKALAAELNATRPGSVITLAADLLELEALPALVEATLASFGRLDVLVNNASTFYPTPIGTITPAQWMDLMGTNLRAPLFLSQAAAPALKASQGLILNITDIHGVRPLRNHPVYSAAKAGLIMLTQSLARELAPEVRVNAIAPGPVMFPAQGLPADVEADILERTLLKRRGAPEDIAEAALFFAAHAAYVTGQMLNVDGGRSVRG